MALPFGVNFRGAPVAAREGLVPDVDDEGSRGRCEMASCTTGSVGIDPGGRWP